MSERDYITYGEGSEPPPGGHVFVGRCRWVRVGDRWRPAATVGRGFRSWAELLRSSAVQPTSRPVAGGVVVEPVVRPVSSAGRAAALRGVRDI